MMHNKQIVAVATLVLAVFLLWFFFFRTKPVKNAEEALEVISTAPSVQVETNPVKNVPNLNPVEKTNPFKIPNPFE